MPLSMTIAPLLKRGESWRCTAPGGRCVRTAVNDLRGAHGRPRCPRRPPLPGGGGLCDQHHARRHGRGHMFARWNLITCCDTTRALLWSWHARWLPGKRPTPSWNAPSCGDTHTRGLRRLRAPFEPACLARISVLWRGDSGVPCVAHLVPAAPSSPCTPFPPS